MRSCRPRLRNVIAIILAAIAYSAAAQPPVLSVLTGELHAAPRETITLMARLQNTSGEATHVRVEVAAPSGWRLLLPPAQVSLEAGEARLLPIPLLLPEHAAAGEHELVLTVTMPEASASQRVIVTVARVRQVDAGVERAPSSSLPEPYEVAFRLTNRGNQPESFRLTVQSNRQLPITLEPDNLALAPGESTFVRVMVPALTGLERPAQHVLTLIATPQDGEPVRVTSATNVIAMAQPARLAYHTFPVRFGVTLEGGTGGAVSVRRLEARGRGRLTEDGDTDISFHVRYSPLVNERRYELTIANPTWTALLGEQKQALGRHLPTAEGFGASLHLRAGHLNTTIFGLATDTGPQAGFSVTAPPLWGATFTARGAFGADRAILAVHGLFPGELPNGGQVTLELEPALDLLSGAPAMYTRGTITGPDFRVSGSIAYAGGGYDGASAPRTDFGVSARVQFLPHLTLDAGYDGVTHAQRVAHQANLSLQAVTGPLRWGVRYKHHTDNLGGAEKNERSVALSARVTPAPRSSFSGTATWTSRLTSSGQAASDLLRLELAGVTPLATGIISAATRTEYDLTSEEITVALLGAAWRGSLTDSTSLELALDHDLVGNRTTRFRTGVTHDLRHGARANVKLDARTSVNAALNVTAELGFELPIDLRLARRAGVTDVRGVLRDQGGAGLPSQVIHLAGFTALTSADGSFHFPAIPAGEHTLFVSGLAPNQVTEPALPLRVSAPRGEPLAITVFEGATIRGAVWVQEADRAAAGRGVIEATNVTAAHASGLRLVLVNEAGRREVVTNTQGRFEATGLTPGTWSVTLDAASIPDGYEAREEAMTITVGPGEVAQVGFEIVPVRREIRFTGGGDLGTDVSDP